MRRIGTAILALAAALLTLAPLAIGDEETTDTATPIKYLVVIYQENVSFDHYFGTYPIAANTDGSPFKAVPGTPTVNGLGTIVNGKMLGPLLTNNPNANNPANGSSAINPFRLSHSQASTCDQDHEYGAEQSAFDEGLMDLFPASTGSGESKYCNQHYSYGHGKGIVLGYFDGNTVTALWNYAQHFAMNDNLFGSTFGPSTPGAINLVSGSTYPAIPSEPTPEVVGITNGQGTLISDLDPTGDKCSKKNAVTIRMGGKNIGDLLNARNVSWGAFMGGFDLTVVNANNMTTGCLRSSPASAANGRTYPPPSKNDTKDYIPHHAWFQYFARTANLEHLRPKVPPTEYGTAADTVTNHQYDLHDFSDALKAGHLPSVSFLKAIGNSDGHAGYSDPLNEQKFLVDTINAIQNSRLWNRTAIIVAWDDTDGWYDHQMSPIVNPSSVSGPDNQPQYRDNLNGAGKCGTGTPMKDDSGRPIQGRCGYGPRLPILVISRFAKQNFVDHTLTDQTSILRFIEDNWKTGRIGSGSFDVIAGRLDNMFDFNNRHRDERRLLLIPATGEPQYRVITPGQIQGTHG